MSLVLSINYFLTLFLDTFKQFGRWRIWLLLVGYFGFQTILLIALSRAYAPVYYGLAQAWLNLIAPEKAVGFTHYPGHLMLLAQVFDLTRFYLSTLIEGAVLGVVAILFYRAYTPARIGSGGGRSTHWFLTWLQLVLAWLVINGLFMMIYTTLPDLLSSQLEGAPRRMLIFTYMFQPALHLLILGMLFFAIPYIAIYRVSFLRGIYQSLSLFLKAPLTSLFLAGVVFSGPVLIRTGLQDPARIMERFQPEAIFWVLLAGLVLNIIVYFFWMGTAARRLVDR